MATKNTKQAPKKETNEKPLILIVREPEPQCRRCGKWCNCSDDEMDAGGPA